MRRTGSRLAGAALVLIMAICPVSSRVRCPSDLTLRFDLADGASSTGTPCVRHDGSVTVIVERVNPFLYDVEINGQVFHAN